MFADILGDGGVQHTGYVAAYGQPVSYFHLRLKMDDG